MNGFNHFDAQGKAIMVDVTDKAATHRVAEARGEILVNEAVMSAIQTGTAKKGDVLGVARVAGIMAVKRTSDLIPMCHPLAVSGCSVDFQLFPDEGKVEAVYRQGHRKHRGGDGGPHRGVGGPAHHLRYVQGCGPGHDPHQHPPYAERGGKIGGVRP